MRKTRVGDLEEEVAGYMPQSFVTMYYELVATGLRAEAVDSIEKSRQGMGVTRGSPPGSEGAVINSERSIACKRVIDRKLRELARMDPADAKKPAPRCVSCGHFGSEGWKYCAACGAVWARGGDDSGTEDGVKVELVGTRLPTKPREGLNGHPVSGQESGGGQRWVQLR